MIKESFLCLVNIFVYILKLSLSHLSIGACSLRLCCKFASRFRSQGLCELNKHWVFCHVDRVCLFSPRCPQTTSTQLTINLIPQPFPKGKISHEATQQNLTKCSLCQNRPNRMCTEGGQTVKKRRTVFNKCKSLWSKTTGVSVTFCSEGDIREAKVRVVIHPSWK